jgi:hypothetical protein
MLKTMEVYKAVYCGCLSFKTKDDRWTPMPFPVFYQEETQNPAHHPYFALFARDRKLMITAAAGVNDVKWGAVWDKRLQKYLISNYRHSFRENEFGDFVDGGAEVQRSGGASTFALVLINGIWNVV